MNPIPDPTNGWGEWSKHVLKELERLNDIVAKLEKNQADMQADVKVLKAVSDIRSAQQEKEDQAAQVERSWIRDHGWELFLTGIMILNMALQFKP